MPQLTVRGITALQAMQISKPLIVTLSKLIDCSREDFTFDLISTQSFFMGGEVETYPFVSVVWFDRGQDIQDQFAQSVDEAFKMAGVESLEVAFTAIKKSNYYSEGQHY